MTTKIHLLTNELGVPLDFLITGGRTMRAGEAGAMRDAAVRDGILPLGHDGYLKLWALTKPVSTAEYIRVDEGQDLNPVLLAVLRGVACPSIYVGGPFHQVYDWRGAINAMNQVNVDRRVLLSQCFRFGPAIAYAATEVIRRIGTSSGKSVHYLASCTTQTGCGPCPVECGCNHASAWKPDRNERSHVAPLI